MSEFTPEPEQRTAEAVAADRRSVFEDWVEQNVERWYGFLEEDPVFSRDKFKDTRQCVERALSALKNPTYIKKLSDTYTRLVQSKNVDGIHAHLFGSNPRPSFDDYIIYYIRTEYTGNDRTQLLGDFCLIREIPL